MKKYTVAQLRKKINNYFKNKTPVDITFTGLLLHLKISKQTFYDWRDDADPEVRELIAYCQLMIENSYEVMLKNPKAGAGCVFALKNFGWSDKVTVEGGDNPVKVEMTVEDFLRNEEVNA